MSKQKKLKSQAEAKDCAFSILIMISQMQRENLHFNSTETFPLINFFGKGLEYQFGFINCHSKLSDKDNQSNAKT